MKKYGRIRISSKLIGERNISRMNIEQHKARGPTKCFGHMECIGPSIAK